jgi:GNAT superfamily N-acetyltransferase
MNIEIRNIRLEDCAIISKSFLLQGWSKPVEQYQSYIFEQQKGKRTILVAFYNFKFVGYVSILWNSEYQYFLENQIPEIKDLNVLLKFQKNGIASKLMDYAESIVTQKTNLVGIGFGLTMDYGNAQRLYIKRGYIPDGNGIVQSGKKIKFGDSIIVKDDLAIYLTKKLNA